MQTARDTRNASVKIAIARNPPVQLCLEWVAAFAGMCCRVWIEVNQIAPILNFEPSEFIFTSGDSVF